MAGTRRKPNLLHAVDGTHNVTRHGDAGEARRRLRKNRSAKLPTPPSWLSDYAKREWRRVATILRDQGLLEEADRTELACYCRAWSELRDAQADIDKNGQTVPFGSEGVKLNPAVTAANAAVKQIRDFGVEFGFSPSARAGLQKVSGKPEGRLDKFRKDSRANAASDSRGA